MLTDIISYAGPL